MSKRTAEKPHINTPPEKRPLRSPPEPPQKHIPKPIAPEPHQSGGQTHRQPGFLPFSTMQDFLRLVWIFCKKTFIKFFCGSCDKAPAFLLYMCTEYKPGTPERHRATAKAAPGKAARTAAGHTNEPNQNSKGRTCRRMCKYHRHDERGRRTKAALPCALLGRLMPGEHSHPCLLMGRSTAGGLSSRPKHGLCKVWVCG